MWTFLNTFLCVFSGWNICAANNNGCSHLCFAKPDGTRVCSCPTHYDLSETDKETCRGKFDYWGQISRPCALLLLEMTLARIEWVLGVIIALCAVTLSLFFLSIDFLFHCDMTPLGSISFVPSITWMWMCIYIPHISHIVCLMAVYNSYYWVRSNVSLWRRLWLPLSVHIWSHSPTQPMHEM